MVSLFLLIALESKRLNFTTWWPLHFFQKDTWESNWYLCSIKSAIHWCNLIFLILYKVKYKISFRWNNIKKERRRFVFLLHKKMRWEDDTAKRQLSWQVRQKMSVTFTAQLRRRCRQRLCFALLCSAYFDALHLRLHHVNAACFIKFIFMLLSQRKFQIFMMLSWWWTWNSNI